MRKYVNLLVLLLCCHLPASAFVSITLGYPHKAYRSNIVPSTPILAFQFEKLIHRFSISGIIAGGLFEGYSQTLYYAQKQEGGLVIVGLRGNYYFIHNERFEAYAGIMGSVLACDNGIYLRKKSQNSTVWGSSTIYGSQGAALASESEGFKGGLQVGAHFWLRPHFGIRGEFSYGTALVNVGIILRRRS